MLSVKEYNRLRTVRKALDSGVNPYESINTLSIGTTTERVKVTHKELTEEERRVKFNSTIGNHKWQFIDGDSNTPNDRLTGPVCIACHKAIDTITSVYGRVIVQMMKKVFHLLKEMPNHTVTEVMKVVGIPVYETGYCCRSCFDKLYTICYHDDKGNLKRGIELLDTPVMKVKESYSSGNGRERIHTIPADSRTPPPRRDDNLPRGREKVKRVSTISLGKGGQVLEAEDEEWIIGKLPKERNTEPVDATAYRKLFPAKRKVG